MTSDLQAVKDRILEKTLPLVNEGGWSWDIVLQGTQKADYPDTMALAVFPTGLPDIVAHFSDYTDRKLMERLKSVPLEALRVRDRIRTAIMTRFSILESQKEIVRASLAFWTAPSRVLQGQRVLWRTADKIWIWAGDTATDYNRHTKRALLSSILMGTALVWIDDKSEGRAITGAFVDRRIENVMEIGKFIGTMKNIKPVFTKKDSATRS
jgi:ubiquinone biosynthesis protein COQ9